jgi:poly-beta-1,6-N-acetyl-D-glucosamine synthase
MEECPASWWEAALMPQSRHPSSVSRAADGQLGGGAVERRSPTGRHHQTSGLEPSARSHSGQVTNQYRTRSPGRHRKCAPGTDTSGAPPGPVQHEIATVPVPRSINKLAMDRVTCRDTQFAGLGSLVSLSRPVSDIPADWGASCPADWGASCAHPIGQIVALLPARNESEDIATAMYFLHAQTRRPDRIIVIANNCTDSTADVAAACGAEVMILEGNHHKKAGALNYALAYILPKLHDEDAVLVQDADSYLDPGFIAATARKLGEGFAAAGGNFRGRPGGGLCGILQRNEYARYARDTARKQGRVLCITGVGTLFRVSALRDVAAGIRDGRLPDAGGGYVYSYATFTEDNWMTLALKHLGYQVISPKDATMTTEVMLTWRELAAQRLRWKRGAIEDLLSYGLTKHTLKGWGLQAVAFTGIFASLAYLATLAASPWLGFHVHLLFIALTGVYAIERAITVRHRGWKVAFASLTVFGEWIYDLFLQAVHLRAFWGMAWKTSKVW